MEKIKTSFSQKEPIGAVALGSFDGVHLGHRELFNLAIKVSFAKGLKSAVCTFDPHPKAFLEPLAYKSIYSLEQNWNLIKSLGVDGSLRLCFDKTTQSMTAKDFLDYLYEFMNFSDLVVGFDFKFGRERSAGLELLKSWCFNKKINLHIVEPVCLNGEKVSSSLIKKYLQAADLKKASELLGGSVHFVGETYSDRGVGAKIGFPTLNLKLLPSACIKKGVYFSRLYFKDKSYPAISNLGNRPTFKSESRELILETHALDALPLIKNDEIKVELIEFCRGEQRFESLEALKAQIQQDVGLAKSFFN